MEFVVWYFSLLIAFVVGFIFCSILTTINERDKNFQQRMEKLKEEAENLRKEFYEKEQKVNMNLSISPKEIELMQRARERAEKAILN